MANGAVNREFYTLPKCPTSETSDPDGFADSTAHSQSIHSATISSARPCESDCIPHAERPVCADLSDSKSSLLRYISDNVIGANKIFSGPYGLRNVTYTDFVASGRSLHFIEDYINREVLPEYGNTHTTTSITSLQTTLFRHEARDIIRNACNASEHDSVIFVGSGTTGAVHKLRHSLNLTLSPVVFVGPYEHHSNILPWTEISAQIVRVKATECGQIDISDLEDKLKIHTVKGRQMIGVFSAASNITGVLANTDAVTICLHRYNALAFWDFAVAAPYVKIDMNPYVGGENQQLVYKDAVYFSVHKFVGGTSTPGVLIAKKTLFRNPVPHGCGGGTVFFVRREKHRYLQEPEMREEGGTPAIVGSIRAGLVFQLKEAVGTDVIQERDRWLLGKVTAAWSDCPNLVMLGPLTCDKLPVFSFLVFHPQTGRFLHHNFVAAILNDVFGIQARGGCACAGPYAMDVLGIAEDTAAAIEELIAEDSRLDRVHLRRKGEYSHREIIRPGFVRLNLPYFLDESCVEFILEAVAMVAAHGWKLLPQYLFNPETGEWRQKHFQTFKDRKWLGHISYQTGSMRYSCPQPHVKGPLPSSYEDCLRKAKDIFLQAQKVQTNIPDQNAMFDEAARPFRWFVLPSEASACLRGSFYQAAIPLSELPFCPPSLLSAFGHDHKSHTALQPEESLLTHISSMHISHSEKGIEKTLHPCPQMKFSDGMMQTLDHGFVQQSQLENVDGSLDSASNHTGGVASLAQDGGVDNENNRQKSVVNSNTRHDRETESASDVDYFGAQNTTLTSPHSQFAKVPYSFTTNCNVSWDPVHAHGTELNDPVSAHGRELNGSISAYGKELHDSVSAHRTEINDGRELIDSISSHGGEFKDSVSVSGTEFNSDSNPSPTCCPLLKKKDPKANTSKDQRVENSIQNIPQVKWFPPSKQIFKSTITAVEEYSMLKEGDRVLVCMSGGKDSLSLLHTIRQCQFYMRAKGVRFAFGAVTVDPQTPAYDPSPLKQYLASLKVPYLYESQGILETAENLSYECASICSFCSRMKRGRIYAAARREGYNVLALGQHLDDLAESFLMSFLHNGTLNTMKAHYTVKQGDLRVIRPFVYVREADLRGFAEKNKLPVIAENCPACFEAPKERLRTKQLLAAQEVMFPQVYSSMLAAMRPLMARGVRKKEVLTPGDQNGEDSDTGIDRETCCS